MALFEKDASTTKDVGEYIALLDKQGELMAFVRPAGKVPAAVLLEAMAAKGLNVELRQAKPDVTVIEL